MTDANDSPKTLTDSAYGSLRTDIIQGRWPPDSKLKIEHLRREYALGATPLREALSRLSADGFVVSEGQRGFQVAPISLEELEDITELRIMLEQKALRESLQRGGDDWETGIVASFHQLTKLETGTSISDVKEWEKRNQAFHAALISACPSRWLQRFYAVLYDQHKRYRSLSIGAEKMQSIPMRELHQEHLKIYEAALARDVEQVCEASVYHIYRTVEILREVLQSKQ